MGNYLFAITSLVFMFVLSCTSNNSPATSELEEKRRLLEGKRQELRDELEKKKLDAEISELDNQIKDIQTEGASTKTGSNVEVKTKSQVASGKPSGTINASAVVMRSGPSTSDAKVEGFNQGEKVEILDMEKPINDNEAILRKDMKLYATSDMSGTQNYTVSKGKAVRIESIGENPGDGPDEYNITYKHPQHGNIYATVGSDDLDFISNQLWYKVKRSNGKTGWVFGKFLTKN